MVTGVRIYIEGGGDRRDTNAALRRGFSRFLDELVACARSQGLRWDLIACGARNEAYNDFVDALSTHREAFNVLLVDSEAPVSQKPWEHLKDHDGWNRPQGSGHEHIHFMAQCMEAWFIADVDSIESFYGQGFRRNAIPPTADVEQIDKRRLISALANATRGTQKGAYHKVRHGLKLLTSISPEVVRGKARHCERLFVTLGRVMACGA